jgi:hypothetical protein
MTRNQRAFLAAFRETCSKTKAAQSAGIQRQMHYRWMKEDQQYAEAFDAAQEQAIAVLEDEAIRRSVDGVREPIFWKGVECGYKLVYSDGLLQFMLKAARPDRYRERVTQEHTGPDGAPIAVEVSFVKPE